MKVERISIRNFRRLEDVSIGIEGEETVFVGPNNSGKTSATAVFRSFLEKRPFRIHDFSVSRIADLDAFGADANAGNLPSIDLDIWFKVNPDSIEFGTAFALLPNLSEDFESLGIRLSFRCTDPDKMRADYLVAYPSLGRLPWIAKDRASAKRTHLMQNHRLPNFNAASAKFRMALPES